MPEYVELQTKLYSIAPELFDRPKAKARPSSSLSEEEDPQVLKIQRKIAKIEADVLFDRQEAESLWEEKLIQLRREGAIFGHPAVREKKKKKEEEEEEASEQRDESEKRDISDSQSNAGDDDARLDNKQDNAPTDTTTDNGDDNADLMLGDMFDETETPILDAVREAGLENREPENSPITLRDFGKWTGLSPRRVLEEACKAR